MAPPCDYDLAVVGGGSGGFGAALAAARRGLRVLLVEAGDSLGGTSTLGGVNTWEPTVSGPGLHAELYSRLAVQPDAIGVSRTTHFWTAQEPWGYSRVDRALAYRDTLRRSRIPYERMSRATFEPAALAAEMARLLEETGRVDVRLGARFVAADASGRSIRSLTVESAARQESVRARFVVDATGDLDVCAAVGCETYLGAEPRAAYGEPAAPESHADQVNGVTLCYRVTPAACRAVEPLPPGVPAEPLPQTSSQCEYPCGDININMLPTMEGWEFRAMAPAAARAECEARVRRHWFWLQREHGYDRFRIERLFPMIGVREGRRLVARRVLTEHDARAGLGGQADADRCIALCDHALDVHGAGGRCREMHGPYGIPYECLLPKEYDNLAVACRGAGFSHIAASSCRLTRVIMEMGHAVGLAVAEAAGRRVPLPEADMRTVRAWLAEDNVALDPDDARFPQPAPDGR